MIGMLWSEVLPGVSWATNCVLSSVSIEGKIGRGTRSAWSNILEKDGACVIQMPATRETSARCIDEDLVRLPMDNIENNCRFFQELVASTKWDSFISKSAQEYLSNVCDDSSYQLPGSPARGRQLERRPKESWPNMRFLSIVRGDRSGSNRWKAGIEGSGRWTPAHVAVVVG